MFIRYLFILKDDYLTGLTRHSLSSEKWTKENNTQMENNKMDKKQEFQEYVSHLKKQQEIT